MNLNVISAIFRRNFVAYFSNPTGYVFICVFVLASSFAAFWPAEFFNANLANLDQLNQYLPFILLAFIPAISMSVWADERRQGTDELLLTIPATDMDVVLGKYLAVVAIYSVSLLFSMISNFLVLSTLGVPDFGLVCGTYFGYWIVGSALLAVGMAASFLTSNLTVAFILGAIFMSPFVFAQYGDLLSLPDWLRWIPEDVFHVEPNQLGTFIKQWSIADQFRDFSRGVVSISSIGYFIGIILLMLYLSMVLIGRRHWKGGVEGQGARVHYLVRFIALAAVVLGANMVLARNDRLRVDVTTEQLSSLSKQTREILNGLDAKYPITIDAYISPTVPESYVPTRLNLISALREFQALSGGRIKVNFHNTEPYSEEAQRAETQFDIRPRPALSTVRGAPRQEEIFLGVAFTCGLERVVVPFFDRGLPLEYELIRSIATVASPKRKKLGVLVTDAKLYGGFDMQSFSSTRDEMIIEELKKQYELVQVDPSSPITETYDVLLAVQPSSLSPPQMDNFVACVKAGQATAIFEDPFPVLFQNVPGTDQPKQPAGNPMMMQRQPPGPKGDIRKLWDLLGVDFSGDSVVWQNFNPYPKLPQISKEWLFIGPGSGAKDAFNESDPITSNLYQLLFLYAGGMRGQNASTLKFDPLLRTNEATGTVPVDKILERNFMGQASINPRLAQFERTTNESYIIGAQISGKPKASAIPMSDKEAAVADAVEGDREEAESEEKTDLPSDEKSEAESDKPAEEKATVKPAPKDINVVLISDIDCLSTDFFLVRARGQGEENELMLDFDNVTFVLNTLDNLAGDDRFVEIRKRRFKHRTLDKLTLATENARNQADAASEESNNEYEREKNEVEKKFDDEIARLQKRKDLPQAQLMQELVIAKQDRDRRLATAIARLDQDLQKKVKQIETDLTLEVRRVQDSYKLWAVLLPPIPPLLVGLYVFFNRRQREREGVSKSRLR